MLICYINSFFLGESVEEGIKREVFEETGFKIFIPRQKFFHLNELIEKDSVFIFKILCFYNLILALYYIKQLLYY